MGSENIAKYNVILELITESKKANEGINAVEKKVGSLGTLFKAAGKAFVGYFTVDAIIGAGKKIFDITKKYQQYATILKVATGSEQEAEKSMKLIEDTAKGTTFSVDELTSSYIKMINRGIKPTKDEILAIADLAASQGKSFDQLTEAILDATTGEWERLKEFGIKATSEGDKVNLSFKGVNKTIEKTPEAIKKAIIEMGKMKGVTGSNAQQMNTLNGIISNMGDNAEKIWKNIGERLKKFYTENLSGVAKMVEWLSKITEISLADKFREEQVEVNSLVARITDLNTTTEERSDLITTLNEKYPFFLNNIDKEKVTNEELAKRMSVVNSLYETRIRLQIQEDKINDLRTKKAELSNKVTSEEVELETIVQASARKYNINLSGLNTLYERQKKVREELYKIQADPKRSSSENWDALFKRFEVYTHNIRLFNKENQLSRSSVNDELEKELQVLKSIEKQTGYNIESLNKIFAPDTAAPKSDPTKPKAPKTKNSTEDAEKVRQQKMLDDLEKIYIQKEILAKKEITNQEQLSRKLQEIELEKQISILSLKRTFVKSSSKEYFEITNELEDVRKAYDIFNRTINEITTIKVRNEGLEEAKKDVSSLQDEYQLLLETLISIDKLNKQGLLAEGLGKNTKMILDIIIDPEQAKRNVDKAYQKGLEDVTSRMLKTVKAPPEKDKRNFWEKLLGMDEDTKQALISSVRDLKDELLDLYDIEIYKIDQLIDKQQERVDKAEQLAEKGKVKQLQIEEERLRELQEKREKYAKQQQAIESVQIVSAQSLAAAQAIQGLVSSFKSGGPAGIATGVAWLMALGASIISIKNAVSSSFADIPTNIEGTELVQADPRYRDKKVSNGQDGYLARFDGKERIVEPGVNKELGNFPNKLLPQAVQAYKLIPTVVKELRHQVNTTKDNDLKIERLEKKMDEVKKSIESIKIITKFDKNGFMQQIERDFDEVRRRKIIKG